MQQGTAPRTGDATPGPIGTAGPLERALTVVLGAFRLNSVRSKMTALALIATLLPSLTMGVLFYTRNKRLLEDKIAQELQSVSAQASRELDLRVRERLYDIRVFSTASVVTETSQCLLEPSSSGCSADLARLENYLDSVCAKFSDYEELLVLDAEGRILATSGESTAAPKLPHDWLALARSDRPILGEAVRDEKLDRAVVVIGEAIRSVDDRFMGVIAAKLNFQGFGEILGAYSAGASGRVRLIDRRGRILVGLADSTEIPLQSGLAPDVAQELFSRQGRPLEYEGSFDSAAVGSVIPLQQFGWGVLTEIDKQVAYAQIAQLRNITLLIVSGLILTIGLAAWLLGLTVVLPLDRLRRGSAGVAEGDLMIELPVVGRGEVAYLTDAFNEMVRRLLGARSELDAKNEALRQKNAELQTLSTTDSLTGLHNRHSLMQLLAREVEKSRRLESPLALLMIDVDHFKSYNDSHGHLAGDEMLRKLARQLESALGESDHAARYGGEEFVVVLPRTDLRGALEVAERIRQSAEEAARAEGEATQVTLSIGLSCYPACGGTADGLLREADVALYTAKRSGRNRVAAAAPLPVTAGRGGESAG